MHTGRCGAISCHTGVPIRTQAGSLGREFESAGEQEPGRGPRKQTKYKANKHEAAGGGCIESARVCESCRCAMETSPMPRESGIGNMIMMAPALFLPSALSQTW